MWNAKYMPNHSEMVGSQTEILYFEEKFDFFETVQELKNQY